jgi:hypothetical protein
MQLTSARVMLEFAGLALWPVADEMDSQRGALGLG